MLLALILATTNAAYHVQFRPRLQAFGYTGELRLRISSDGYVNGTYRPDTGGELETVRGGRQGKKIWFDIPTLGGIHVEATMEDGTLSGVAAPTGPSNAQYIVTGKLEPSPSP